MEGAVTSFDWDNLLAGASAHGNDTTVAVLLLQLIEFRAVMALDSQGGDDEW